jgi:hypothetical protein
LAERFCSNFRAAGSRRAQQSNTPIPNKVEIRADPPYDSSGSGTPAIGIIRSTTARLTSDWKMNQIVTPPAA